MPEDWCLNFFGLENIPWNHTSLCQILPRRACQYIENLDSAQLECGPEFLSSLVLLILAEGKTDHLLLPQQLPGGQLVRGSRLWFYTG